jgi:hypothetical protein
MFQCPHCQQPIQFESGTNMPWWNRELGSPRASLGCGTLILIAIIVAVCSGGLNNNNELHELQREIRTMREMVEALTEKAVAPVPVEAVEGAK